MALTNRMLLSCPLADLGTAKRGRGLSFMLRIRRTLSRIL